MTRMIKKYDNKFTIISNNAVQDNRLSWKARGIFTYLWSMPDDWNFYETEVAKHATDGRDSLRSGLAELKKYGYLKSERERLSNGRLGSSIWILNDVPNKVENPIPMLGNTTQGLPLSEKSTGGETTLQNNYNTKNLNYKGSTNKQTKAVSADADLLASFEKIWQLYPNKADKKHAFSYYKKWRKESVDHTDDYLFEKLAEYKKHLAANPWKSPMNGSTWFNGRFNDNYLTNNSQGYQQLQQPQSDDGFSQKLVDDKWTQYEINTAVNGVNGLSQQQKAYYMQPIDKEGNTQYRLDYLAGTAIPISDALERVERIERSSYGNV